MTQPTKASASKIHWPTFWILFLVLGLGALITRTQDGMETFTTVFKGFFSVFTTPFILEGISMVFMGFIVVIVNRWKRHRQPSDWVIMPITEETEEDPDPSDLKAATSSIREALQAEKFDVAYQGVKALTSFPSDAPSVLVIAEALAKNYRVDEAMDILQVHQRQFPSSEADAVRAAFFNDIAQWLSQQGNDLAKDVLPRWHQLQLLQSTPVSA